MGALAVPPGAPRGRDPDGPGPVRRAHGVHPSPGASRAAVGFGLARRASQPRPARAALAAAGGTRSVRGPTRAAGTSPGLFAPPQSPGWG